jgi:hypothetical protein
MDQSTYNFQLSRRLHMTTLTNSTTNPNEAGILGESQEAEGVRGIGHKGAGVSGTSEKWIGTYGESQEAEGVRGFGHKGAGVNGTSGAWHGVYGETPSTTGGAGVWGEHKTTGAGVWGSSESGEGVHAETKSPTVAAIAGFNLNPNGTGAAVYGEKQGPIGHAGFFKGNVHITGNLTADGDIVLSNADCAEDFDVSGADKVEPGTVMVLGNEGVLFQSQQAYDKHVAGVISGAGDYKPGIVLDSRKTSGDRQPIALMGKVFCKVDAQFGAIQVGDLLTTSPTPGHAMVASEPVRAFGTIIGKALRPLLSGQGLIPILVTLQ